MLTKIVFTLAMLLTLTSCKGQNNDSAKYIQTEPLHINRFDKDLFSLIESKDSSSETVFRQTYSNMLNIVGQGILNMKETDSPIFLDKLINFYSEPTLKKLYSDALAKYAQADLFEKQLGYGFAYLKEHFPSMQIPAVYMHISGLNQNVLVSDSLLSISIDKYMGEDYSLYQDFFYDYQLRKMQPALIVPDFLAGWLMSEFPFEGKENVLLDRMIYEGKMKYLVQQTVPEIASYTLMGYTDSQEKWCIDHEKTLWKEIISRKHLYTPDHVTTNKYFEDMPCTFLTMEAPGNIGSWIGWQIIKAYMKETGATPDMLMKNTNSQDILTQSKYKP